MNFIKNIIIVVIIVIISSAPSWYRSLLPTKSKNLYQLIQVFFVEICGIEYHIKSNSSNCKSAC